MTTTADTDPHAPAAQRRRLTLLYTDLSGSTVLGAAMEPEHYRALLQALRRIWHAVADAHQGRVVLTQGDGALLAFGIHQAGEQDGRHAAEAALQVHAQVSALRPPAVAGVPGGMLPLRMHSGIHAGLVLLSDGDIEQGVYDLSGDVLNTTVALARGAGPGSIVASQAAMGPNALFFDLGDAPSDSALPALQGQTRRVLGRSGVTRRFDATARRGLTPFVGRAGLLARLQQFIGLPSSASPADRPRCTVLQGGPGLGKTRLLEQLLAGPAAAGLQVLRGSCESDLHAEVLQPFVRMLRPVPQPAGEPSAPASLADLLHDALIARAQAGPCLLVIDDWQWADDASRQLLQRLLVHPQGPLLLLASRPRDAGGDWVDGAPHLSVDAFSPDETAQAVQELLPRPDPFLVARIHDYAGGVPLFVEELCHSVSAEQVLRTLDGRAPGPGWLATLVVARLERLPAAQASVLRAAAVVGNVIPLHWLAVACGAAPAPGLLKALSDADFLRCDGRDQELRFKHGITRDAVYASIGLQQRMALHQRLQQALLEEAADSPHGDTLEALAFHCQGAGDAEGAARYAEQAGDKAFAAFAVDRARLQYQAALQAIDRLVPASRERLVRWCEVSNKLGLICVFDPVPLGNDLSTFERSLAQAQTLDDPGLLARTEYWLGYVCYTVGRLREGTAHAQRGLERARRIGDLRLAAQIEATLGQFLVAACRYDEAAALMDTALRAKQQRRTVSGSMAIGSAYTLSCKASLLADQGDFMSAQTCLAEALALLQGSTHPVGNSVRNWQAIILIWQGRFDEAQRVCKLNLQVAINTQALLLLGIGRAVDSYLAWRCGGGQAAVQALVDAVRWIEQPGGQFYASLFHGWLTEAWAAQGGRRQARHHAARTLARAAEGERIGEAVACRAMAEAAVAEGRLPVAHRWLRRAERSAQVRRSQREAALNRLCAARLAWAAGQVQRASDLAAASHDALAAMQLPWHAAQALAGPWNGRAMESPQST